MSGYFDGLMRASGLAVGDAPMLGGAPQESAGLAEIDVSVPAAAPLVTPLDVTAHSVPQMRGVLPSTSHVPLSAGVPVQPAPIAAPPPEPNTDTGPPPLANVAVPLPVGIPTASGRLQDGVEPEAAPVITQERIIQAALQWVAAGSTAATLPLPGLPADPVLSRELARTLPAVASAAAVPAASTPLPAEPAGASTAAQSVTVQPPQLSVAAVAQPLAVAPMPSPRPSVPERDDAVQVSIGAIHLRVEAPASPSVQATPAPPAQRPVATSQAAPRSGLSRRALRRI